MGLFGGYGGGRYTPGIVATPDDKERERQVALQLGVPYEFDAPDQGLLAEQQAPQPGFWQGGDKFRGRDAIAGLLAAIGDGLMAQGGIHPSAAQGLLGGRADAMEMARKKAEEQAALAQQMAIARQAFPDMNDAQAAAVVQKIGNPSDFKPEAPPPMVRDVEAWQQMTPEQKAAAGEMYSTRSPWRVMGQDGRPYQMNEPAGGPQPGSVEDGHQFIGGDPADPKNWKPVAGGGTGNGAGGFRFP